MISFEEKNRYKNVLYEQLCMDYNCTLEQIKSSKNEFVELELLPGRRRFREDNSVLKVLCINGKIICATSKNLLPEAKTLLEDVKGEWFSNYKTLKKVDEFLNKHGHHVDDFHHFCLPLGLENLTEKELSALQEGLTFYWYDRDSVEVFRGDSRFTSALTFLETAPDVLAVTAVKDGEILGMAGASADCEDMWQIGINVNSQAQGGNIGALLTIMLKKKILEMGKIPFYGTAESHIQSQTVEVKSGFIPSWAELCSGPGLE